MPKAPSDVLKQVEDTRRRVREAIAKSRGLQAQARETVMHSKRLEKTVKNFKRSKPE